MQENNKKGEGCSSQGKLDRRNFIKTAALGAGALTFTGSKIFAGPFDPAQIDFLVPEDKKLSEAWLRSLYERGKPEVFSSKNDELKYIGMPVGGIACGQLYLAGDGRLRLWHIFKVTYSREKDHGQRFDAMTLGGHYAEPEKQFARETRPVEQGAAIRVKSAGKQWIKRLDSRDFTDINFRGEYPIGKVEYKAEDFPVKVNLEAFSPFIPNNAEESALPATILEYQVSNESSEQLEIDLVSWLENAVLPYVDSGVSGSRRSTLMQNGNRTTLHYTPEGSEENTDLREDIIFEDFESGSYKNWTVSGDAFGAAPFAKEDLKHWQPLSNYKGNFFVNTHNSRNVSANGQSSAGAWSVESDSFTGSLSSKEFIIERNFINFLIGGGSHAGNTSINLLVEGKTVQSINGNNSNAMVPKSFNVSHLQGKTAQLKLIDNYSGGWGHISLDHIVFSDSNGEDNTIENQHGYGSMAISLIDNEEKNTTPILDFDTEAIARSLEAGNGAVTESGQSIKKAFHKKAVGALAKSFVLEAGESKNVRFVISWFFPYLNQQEIESGQLLALKGIKNLKRHYFNRFNSAAQVADYIQLNAEFLIDNTKLWNKTWYDSTLPYWLLDRAFIPIDCLASNTVVWFDNGRFWAWEGVECCPGTCQHVWHYAQGMARVFPEFERWLRENIDFGSGLNPDGSMGHRDETAGGYGAHPAHDGHCGTIIRAYREHRMTADNSFLKKNYQGIKKAVQFIINEDKDKDGLLEGGQTNTLDASWYGPMGWISSLYLGALAVGKEMALEMDDQAFAQTCENLLIKGQGNIVTQLYNGEYFIHKPDPAHGNAINSNDGCLIDQVLGQSLAFQAGLRKRVVPEQECKSALNSIWKYNFAPDAFWYQKHHKPIKGARIYATEGEAGTLMCTWPKGGADKAVPGMPSRPDESETWLGPGGYFDECMNGFEYQLASHLIFEDEVEKGLALTKVVHDRYAANKRNPYNEIECGDHYSRSMASYGVFIATCGFNYHGPKGELSIAPKIEAANFRAPFTTAQGWGTISQQLKEKELFIELDIKYGSLRLKSLSLNIDKEIEKLQLQIGDSQIVPRLKQVDGNTILEFDELELSANDKMVITALNSTLKRSQKSGINMYPNPFSEKVMIKSDETQNKVSIYNMNGEMVFSETGEFSEKEINLAFLSKGMYVLKTEGDKGTNTKQIIKS